ncbi:MAG TPA: NAD(P)-dependent oxidoreductase [Chloroflexi bacterium]|nr:NAD(P)-dependent oxidoreductase [Chloroflexota bacterium]HHW86789.1 SDR family oxidoreductase [Chloroflexota bacterium]
MTRLAEKVILITGAASGIGRAAALGCAAEGARVVLFDIAADALAETAASIGEERALAVTVNLTQPPAVEAAVAQAVEHWGRLDGVFNVAGGSGRRHGDGPVDQCTVEGWHWTLDLNLTSVFLVCKYATPALLASRGAIVNLASVLGLVGGDADFATHAYAASKAGVIGLSRAMASYYAPAGLRVNVIAPGLIATPMSQRAQQDPAILARLPQLQPLTGAMGTPEDVAAAAVYLLSDDARFVTGVVLTVDGGWTVR